MNKQSGFTLIEIVMVLVLLGILSAVAVPKYFDLQKQAEAKAAQAVGAEYQAQLNGKFAKGLLEGDSCATARKNAIAEANTMKLNGSTFTVTALDATTTDETAELSIKGQSDTYTFKVAVPVCTATTSSGS